MSIRYHILRSSIYGDGRLTLFDDPNTPEEEVVEAYQESHYYSFDSACVPLRTTPFDRLRTTPFNSACASLRTPPFGMLMEGPFEPAAAPENDYLYNTKELNKDFGLDWYDYGARWYDAAIGRWGAVDPLAEIYVSISPYVYVVNNPTKYIDLDGRLIRDPDGNIVFAEIGYPSKAVAPTGDKALVQWGYIFADDGTKLKVARNLSSDKRFDCNCHGVTFGDGQFWIGNDVMNELLAGDSYVEIEGDVYVGDVVVYYNKEGEIVHSTTVIAVNDETGEVTVTGLGGLEEEETVEDIEDAWTRPGTTYKIYRKYQTDKVVSEEEVQILKDENRGEK